MSVNYGDVLEAVAGAVGPLAPAVICDGQITTWRQFDQRANALARALLAAGLQEQSKVALYMRNGPDYLIAFTACLKARLVPVNINYRYGADEILYLFENSDTEAVIFDAAFSDTVVALRARAPMRLWVCARGDLAGATSLIDIYDGPNEPLDLRRSPEDIFLLYTGGTTGMPKGVMWPSSAVWGALAPSRAANPDRPPPQTLEALVSQVASGGGYVRLHIAPPLMHGTGLFAALSVLSRGGTVVCSAAATFNPEAIVADLALLQCDGLVIVGDAFARPILDVLRAGGGRHDVSHVSLVVSSGMMWSPEVKQGLLEFMPDAVLSDGLGATESSSIAFSVTTKDGAQEPRFVPNGAVVVKPHDLSPVVPGSGEIGVIAKAGDLPLGYYKDPERTAKTYLTINGVRHMVGGDHATVEADGTIRLLGRGSHCINSAGEKIYPEEVEEALKTHPDVQDALVFGLPDERFGQRVAALVASRVTVDESALIAHVRGRLAAYKAPKTIAFAPVAPRAPNGKADYVQAKILFNAAIATRDAGSQGHLR